MKNIAILIITLVIVLTALTSCDDKKAEQSSNKIVSNSSQNFSSPSTQQLTDTWIGQWSGPEGTFLKITGNDGRYDIVIQNLDGPKHYQGISRNNAIEFERDGIKEKINATDGAATGMKWLSEKTDCLTIKSGEGFCKN